MPTLETRIFVAIQSAVNEAVAYAGLGDAVWSNTNAPEPPTEYARATWIPNRPSRFGVDDNSSASRPGIVQIMLMTRLNRNLAVAVKKAGLVASQFPQGRVVHFEDGSVPVRFVQPPHVGQSTPHEAYLETPVTLQYIVL